MSVFPIPLAVVLHRDVRAFLAADGCLYLWDALLEYPKHPDPLHDVEEADGHDADDRDGVWEERGPRVYCGVHGQDDDKGVEYDAEQDEKHGEQELDYLVRGGVLCGGVDHEPRDVEERRAELVGLEEDGDVEGPPVPYHEGVLDGRDDVVDVFGWLGAPLGPNERCVVHEIP